jgi:hypothetical protein
MECPERKNNFLAIIVQAPSLEQAYLWSCIHLETGVKIIP